MSTFNSRQYRWKDITIVIGGKVIEGVTEIEYSKKTKKEYLYGRGSKPHNIQSGNDEYDGKIELWQSTVEALIEDAPNKDISKLSFDVVNTYDPLDGGASVTDVLKSVEITEITKGMKQGDTHKLISLPIMFLDIEYQR